MPLTVTDSPGLAETGPAKRRRWAHAPFIGVALLMCIAFACLDAEAVPPDQPESRPRDQAGVADLFHARHLELVRLATLLVGDQATGVAIVRKALEEPLRQIAHNAGKEGSVVIEEVRQAKGKGYDALNDVFVDMFKSGIVDPAKVTRSALQNAASIAAMVLTTEAVITEIPEQKGNGGGMGGMSPDMM